MSPQPKPADSQSEWVNAIRQKVRSNLVLPAGTPSGIHVVFSVVQLPNGEVVSASLQASSGYPEYDRAAHRAILMSSPLPKPEDPREFVKALVLRFTP
jgi:colicin import membrane protein